MCIEMEILFLKLFIQILPQQLKFIYSEKATKSREISTEDLTATT